MYIGEYLYFQMCPNILRMHAQYIKIQGARYAMECLLYLAQVVIESFCFDAMRECLTKQSITFCSALVEMYTLNSRLSGGRLTGLRLNQAFFLSLCVV
jgi:hypothetical protein